MAEELAPNEAAAPALPPPSPEKPKSKPKRPPDLIAADYLLLALKEAALRLRRAAVAEDPDRTAKTAAVLAKALRDAQALKTPAASQAQAQAPRPAPDPKAQDAVADEETEREILGRLARRAAAARSEAVYPGNEPPGETDPCR